MNTLLTISMITREALRVLENNLTFTKLINRQFDDKFGVEGAKIGTVLNVRKPPRYLGRTGQALAPEAAAETQVPVTLNTQFGVDLMFSSQDLALSIDDFSDRFIKPAIATVANKIDADGLALYNQIYQTVGTPGTMSAALLTYLQAGVKLDDSAAPIDGQRSVVITPLMQATIVDSLKGLFQQASALAEQYEKGRMGVAAGFNWYMDQNVSTHQTGTWAGTPLVNGANQTGASIIIDGWTGAGTDTLKKGDILQFAGVFKVNPQSRQNTAALQDFVVTADKTLAASDTVTIDPPIITSGAYQTVSNSPADNAAVSIFGAAATTYSNKLSPTGLVFHRDFATLVTADLPLPGGVDMAARVSDKQLGMSIRMIRAYDINTDLFPCRLDILYGWAVLRPELATRYQG